MYVEPGVGFLDPSDAALVERWRGGDATAFALLVRRWQQPIARFLTRLLGRPDLVGDLCQEVFLRAFQAGARYRECGTFSAWLYRIALNVARDTTRRWLHPSLSLGNGEPVAATPSPDAICALRETTQLVTAAVAELPEPLRLVLVLRHYENMSFAEIARLTTTPASTLKSRFATALNHLRARLRNLDRDCEEPHP
jgi:RNA polymerase sigma-70 factor (ECF subfamily)